MLSKMDHEESVNSYAQLAQALAQATATKNRWSRHRGYPPEILMFRKGTRNPASVMNDEERAAHEMALRPHAEGLRFRAELECRERARRASAAVDNDQTLCRALNSHSRPTCGQYSAPEWVMLWKRRGEAADPWEGSMQVIVQESDMVIWVTKGSKLYRAAPEHVIPLSAVEEWSQQMQSTSNSMPTQVIPQHGGVQYHNVTPMTVPDAIPPSNQLSINPERPSAIESSEINSDPEPEAAPERLVSTQSADSPIGHHPEPPEWF